MDSTLTYFATGLFALALLAGCAAKVNSPIEGALRSGRRVNTESTSKPSKSKSSNQTEPPSITYRPGG
jgi:hypothetical protein